MIPKIKQVVQDYLGTPKEWFLTCLKTGGWQYHDFGYYQEWGIGLMNGIEINIQDLLNGEYRVSVGTPSRDIGIFSTWDTKKIHESDPYWQQGIRQLLDTAHDTLKSRA